MVDQVGDRPAQLCLGGITLELPPRCGTLPIANWDWSRVGDEHQAGGVTWGGEYHVVGTYDGTSFTVSEVGPPGTPSPDPSDDIVNACPEPAGGWVASDPSRTSRATSRRRSGPPAPSPTQRAPG